MLAAESGTERASGIKHGRVETEQVQEFLADRSAKLDQKGQPIHIEEFEYKVRRMINDYVGPPKNEYRLDRALWWMDRFERELQGNSQSRGYARPVQSL